MTVCAHRAMVSAMRSAFLSVLLLLPQAAAAATVPLDISGVRPGPIGVVRAEETVAISWPDETGREWRAVFSLDPAKPLIVVDRHRHRCHRPRRASVLSGRDRQAPRRMVCVLRRSDDASGGHAARAGHAAAARRRRAQRRRTPGDRVRGRAPGKLRRRARLHVLSRQPPDPAGSGPDDERARRGVLLRRRPRDGGAVRSPAGQQHEHGGGLLRHRGRAPPQHVERSAGRARPGAGALSHAGVAGSGRKRGGVPGAAPLLLPARLHVESGLRLASCLARSGRARHQATARRELAVLPVDERAARTAAADGRVLPALVWRTGQCARGRAPLHQQRSLSPARGLQDTQHALAPGRHGSSDGEWVRLDAAVQAGAEGDGRRRLDDHGFPWRRPPRRPHGSAPRRVARVLCRAPCAVGSRLPADSQRGSQRASRRPLGAGVSEAGVLVHGPSRERRRWSRNIRNTARSTASADAQEMFELVQREGGYMYQTHPRTKGSTGFPDKILGDSTTSAIPATSAPGGRRCPRISPRRVSAIARSTSSTS